MATPRKALGDIRNQVLGTPKSEYLKSTTFQTPVINKEPTTTNSQFISFQGDDFEVYNEDKVEEGDELIETFDVEPESPDYFDDILERYKLLEKIVLEEDYSYADSEPINLCDHDFEDLDLSCIIIKED